MKPLEQEITFFLRLAWEIGKTGALTEDVDAFVADWIDRMFTGKIGRQVSGLLNDFSQLTNVRKLENMDYDAFRRLHTATRRQCASIGMRRCLRRGMRYMGVFPRKKGMPFSRWY